VVELYKEGGINRYDVYIMSSSLSQLP